MKTPLAVLIPLGAVAMVAGIGIPIGLLFLGLHDWISEDATLVVAVILTAGIMAVATALSLTWARREAPATRREARPAGQPERVERPAPGARVPRTERPARGGRSRANERRRPR